MKNNFVMSGVLLILTNLTLTGCSSDYTDFDTNPNHYKTAQLAKNIVIPEYIAANIEHQPLYPVPGLENLKGDLTITSVPPSLSGKIREY